MERLADRIQDHRWKALAGCAALLSGYLVLIACGPQVADAYALLHAWGQQRLRRSAAVDSEGEDQRLNARKQQLQRRFADLYVSLPRSEQTSAVVQVLQQSADTAGVALTALRPDDRVEHAQYEELPVEVGLHGTFHDVGRFVHRIEQSASVIKVQALELQRASASSDGVDARLVLHVITLKERRERQGDEPPRPVAAPQAALPLGRPGSASAYDASSRAPFVPPPALFGIAPEKARKPVRPPAPPPALPISLDGIVGATALLQRSDGAVLIVRTGGRVGETKILAVRRDHVVVRHAGRVSRLYLHR